MIASATGVLIVFEITWSHQLGECSAGLADLCPFCDVKAQNGHGGGAEMARHQFFRRWALGTCQISRQFVTCWVVANDHDCIGGLGPKGVEIVFHPPVIQRFDDFDGGVAQRL